MHLDHARIDALNRQALAYGAAGNHEEALRCFLDVLLLNQEYPAVYKNCGLALEKLGRLEEALSFYERALEIAPHDVQLRRWVSDAQELLLSRESERLSSIAGQSPTSMQQAPQSLATALFQRAARAQRSGMLAEAERACEEALSADQLHADATHLRGMIELQKGNHVQGEAFIRQAVALRHDAALLTNHGVALVMLGNTSDAEAAFRSAIAIKPDCLDAHYNLSTLLMDTGRTSESEAACRRVLELRPDHASAHDRLGTLLSHRGQLYEAEMAYRRALELQPDYAQAYNNLGNLFKQTARLTEAEAAYRRALQLRPDYAVAHNNLGLLLMDTGRLSEADAAYQRALALSPDCAEVHHNIALRALLLGDYATGWQEYEWRLRVPQNEDCTLLDLPQPCWIGDMSITGQTVLVWAEQGFGDTIQFSRYVPMIHALGAQVVFEVPAPLLPLLATLAAPCQLVAKGTPLPAFDLHCPLGSLPLAFATRLETIPATVPYLTANPDRQQWWRARLGPREKARIGVVASGNPAHRNDHWRSIAFDTLAPLFALDLEFHCLQPAVRATDEPVLCRFPNLRIHGEALGDFASTAALIGELDLVICVDTSVAHLAGALGKPVWILLPYAPDFRWLLDRDDSPWYPTARLFRQPVLGDWPSVVGEVVQAATTEFYE